MVLILNGNLVNGLPPFPPTPITGISFTTCIFKIINPIGEICYHLFRWMRFLVMVAPLCKISDAQLHVQKFPTRGVVGVLPFRTYSTICQAPKSLLEGALWVGPEDMVTILVESTPDRHFLPFGAITSNLFRTHCIADT